MLITFTVLITVVLSAPITESIAFSLPLVNSKLLDSFSCLKTQSPKSLERERDKAYVRQQFNKNFSLLQVTGQKLLKEHEHNKLTSTRLANDTKTINKCAKTLQTLVALGDLAEPPKINKEIDTPEEFDQAIRSLAQHIWNFAHNPIHQNSKIFNTDQAEKAQTDLLSIIDLSKVLENKAKLYSPLRSQQ
ncbi:MAG: hypothetical protein JNK38_11520 [Acidobacteria bacterium]|nr:hypothetical protein [Acidobacteriota bacterium]